MLKSFFCTRVDERDKSEPQPIYFSTSVLIRLSPNKQHFLEQVKYEVSFIITFYVPSRNLIWNRILIFTRFLLSFKHYFSFNKFYSFPFSMAVEYDHESRLILVQSTNKVHSNYKRLN